MTIEKGDFFRIGDDARVGKTKDTAPSSFFGNEFTESRRQFSKCHKCHPNNDSEHDWNLYRNSPRTFLKSRAGSRLLTFQAACRLSLSNHGDERPGNDGYIEERFRQMREQVRQRVGEGFNVIRQVLIGSEKATIQIAHTVVRLFLRTGHDAASEPTRDERALTRK